MQSDNMIYKCRSNFKGKFKTASMDQTNNTAAIHELFIIPWFVLNEHGNKMNDFPKCIAFVDQPTGRAGSESHTYIVCNGLTN